MTVENAGTLAYQYQSLKPPAALQGSGAKLAPNTPIDRQSKLYEQCQEFESIFVQMMLKEMRNTVQKDGIMNGGFAEEIFQDMLYEERAKSMSKNAGLGLADQMYLELLRSK